MELAIAIGLVAVGLILLAAGGEALVRGATAIAALAGVTPAVIGLTVVAFGTSLPELVVSLIASVEGRPALAIGNVIGSNIANVVVILGATALVLPLPVHGTAVRREWPFMFGASVAFLLLARDGVIDRLEAGTFLAVLMLFTAYMLRAARVELTGDERSEFALEVRERSLRSRRVLLPVGAVLLGIVLLVAGGRALVSGAVVLAQAAGLTEGVVGLTVVALGTSAPELATSIVAAARNRVDVAVSNVIGSNIFNLLGIVGTAGLVHPLAVDSALLTSDAWWMLATSALLLPLLRSGWVVSRREGAALLGVYAVYAAQLLAR